MKRRTGLTAWEEELFAKLVRASGASALSLDEELKLLEERNAEDTSAFERFVARLGMRPVPRAIEAGAFAGVGGSVDMVAYWVDPAADGARIVHARGAAEARLRALLARDLVVRVFMPVRPTSLLTRFGLTG